MHLIPRAHWSSEQYRILRAFCPCDTVERCRVSNAGRPKIIPSCDVPQLVGCAVEQNLGIEDPMIFPRPGTSLAQHGSGMFRPGRFICCRCISDLVAKQACGDSRVPHLQYPRTIRTEDGWEIHSPAIP